MCFALQIWKGNVINRQADVEENVDKHSFTIVNYNIISMWKIFQNIPRSVKVFFIWNCFGISLLLVKFSSKLYRGERKSDMLWKLKPLVVRWAQLKFVIKIMLSLFFSIIIIDWLTCSQSSMSGLCSEWELGLQFYYRAKSRCFNSWEKECYIFVKYIRRVEKQLLAIVNTNIILNWLKQDWPHIRL